MTTATTYPVTLSNGATLTVEIRAPHGYGEDARTRLTYPGVNELSEPYTYSGYCHAEIVSLEIERHTIGTRHAQDATEAVEALALECTCEDDGEDENAR